MKELKVARNRTFGVDDSPRVAGVGTEHLVPEK